MLYPQNGDGFVTIDSVTSLHPMYTQLLALTSAAAFAVFARTCRFLSQQLFLFCDSQSFAVASDDKMASHWRQIVSSIDGDFFEKICTDLSDWAAHYLHV